MLRFAPLPKEENLKLRIALFHDNFAQMGGAERVTEVLYETLPGADLFSTLSVPERLSPTLRDAGVRTTWMQRLPSKAKLFRHYFLLYPVAVEMTDLRGYDLVVTSCFGYAKGVRTDPGAVHVCYCHTPMRWVWRAEDYFANEPVGFAKKLILDKTRGLLRWWETRAAARPDVYIANSRVVQQRLKEAFDIDSEVIPPPIETTRFHASEQVGDYFLVLSRLVPYKRIELAVRAAGELGLPLKVIGRGPDLERLKSMAGPTVEFLGRQTDEQVNVLVSQCQALLFPGEEDFGMAPLEVNAAGRPVIAFYGGGAMETVREGVNGLFFHEPTTKSLVDAIQRFRSLSWSTATIQEHAADYDTAAFQRRIREVLVRATDGRFPAASDDSNDSPDGEGGAVVAHRH